ncbi:hypothetical protein KKG38_03260 [Patescibacteria group bacterium]|nr:hypothetical protein [Patescibacteria group bacterium]
MGGYATRQEMESFFNLRKKGELDRHLGQCRKAYYNLYAKIFPVYRCTFFDEGQRHRDGYRLGNEVDTFINSGVLPGPSQRFMEMLRLRQAVGIYSVLDTFSLKRTMAVGGIIDPIVRLAREVGVIPFQKDRIVLPSGELCTVYLWPGSELPDPKWISGPQVGRLAKPMPSKSQQEKRPITPPVRRPQTSTLINEILRMLKNYGTLTMTDAQQITGFTIEEIKGLLQMVQSPEDGYFRWAGPVEKQYLRWIGPR